MAGMEVMAGIIEIIVERNENNSRIGIWPMVAGHYQFLDFHYLRLQFLEAADEAGLALL